MFTMTKKVVFLLSVYLFFNFTLAATPSNNIKEYTLENGLKVFLLEDSTDALTHMNFVCKAGFSSQTQYTNGFFKLFTRLIQASSPQLNFTNAQCNADYSIYSLSFTASQTEDIIQKLSDAIFNPNFSDEVLSSELTKLKNEVTQNADTMSTYINAAIDSRVFSDAPWKHDSGIYPPLFKKTTEKTARSIISDISTRWYTPKNCGIFIYGNINSEKLLVSIKNYFGRFYSNYNTPTEKPSIPINSKRKYVFHNDEISNELTQVVVQYTLLNPEQADLMAATLNNPNSTFKQNILNNIELNIPGEEYIDVSSAFKRNSSRLIIQTLMQPPENKKSKITPLDQAQTFTSAVKQLPVYPDEFLFAKSQLIYDLNYQASNPSLLMEKLTMFWPIQEYYSSSEEDFQIYPESTIASLFHSRKNYIQRENLSETIQTLNAEEPFVFVIINSKVYKTYKKAFSAAGFEEINSTNSSWYVQEMFKNIKDQFKPEESFTYNIGKTNTNDNYYFAKNMAQISTSELSNGIKVISKKNNNSTGTSMLLSISGGKVNSINDHGFEEVMVNLMSVLIQKELYRKMSQGLILGNPVVTSKTDIATSSILIDFEEEDTAEVCSAISNAIIFGEIAPADADRAVSSRQYKKRLENGSASSQMVSAIIKSVYGKNDLAKIYDTEKDILLSTDYNKILNAYPALLDADRFTVIISGNYEDSIYQYLEKSLCLLSKNGYTKQQLQSTNSLSKSKYLNVKLRHTFLTDIPAEKAGPQPAVLIPTTEFLDPVIYAANVPEQGTKNAALYNAMLNYISELLKTTLEENKKLDNNSITIQFPQNYLDLSLITISNVAHTKELDAVYKSIIQTINNDLQKPQATQNIVQQIKDQWSIQQMNLTSTNSGTALLLQKGLEMFPDKCNPEFYLQEYNYIQSATVQDFIDIMEYFPSRPVLRVYSSDGKN